MGNSTESFDTTKLLLGIDIGGSFIKVGIVNSDSHNLLKTISIATPDLSKSRSCTELAQTAANLLDDIASSAELASNSTSAELEAIGIAIPGVVNNKDQIEMLPNVNIEPSLLSQALIEALGNVPVSFCNDANAASVGEMLAGAARQFETFVLITIGTGIGAGLVINGTPLLGCHGAAGEIGHLKIKDTGPACGCGGQACLEQYASARALAQNAQAIAADMGFDPKSSNYTNAKAVLISSMNGDKAALLAVQTMCEMLARAMASISCLIDPQAIIIGGGISQTPEAFLEILRGYYRQYAIPTCKDTLIITAELGNTAGMIGAAHIARQANQIA